jgi:hypothetical protein
MAHLGTVWVVAVVASPLRASGRHAVFSATLIQSFSLTCPLLPPQL